MALACVLPRVVIMDAWYEVDKKEDEVVSYTCTKQCGFIAIRADVYLEHLAECPLVAQWIMDWAKRMIYRGKVARG